MRRIVLFVITIFLMFNYAYSFEETDLLEDSGTEINTDTVLDGEELLNNYCDSLSIVTNHYFNVGLKKRDSSFDSLYKSKMNHILHRIKIIVHKEYERKFVEISEKEHALEILSDEHSRLIKYFLIALLFLTIGLLILLYNRYRVIVNSKKTLERKKTELSNANTELQVINKELMAHKEKLEFLNDELNQTNQKLVESEKKLLATNSSKDKFFSIISHDLRNPFASIASFSRIIKRDIDVLSKAELKELAIELDKSIIKINNLLDNLLVWSRSQSGRTVFHPQYLNISHIIEDSIEFIEGSITEKDVKVHNKISDDLVVYADKNMLESIIRNLLTNAIKYSTIGGEISLNADIKDNKAFISIADQGVGIPEENKSKILNSEMFFSTYGTKDEKGSGLGLHITKEFVKKHGGEIFFESEEGKGTVFTFSLPLEEEQI